MFSISATPFAETARRDDATTLAECAQSIGLSAMDSARVLKVDGSFFADFFH